MRSGWWSATPSVLYPDVPPGGLAIQGGPTIESPTAYAAIAFSVAALPISVKLRLVVAPQAASTPEATPLACPLTDPSFEPSHGGSLSDAPSFDCGKRAVTAEKSPDGSTFAFDLTPLIENGIVAVAVMPSAPTERVVFLAPTTSSVEVSAPEGASDERPDAHVPDLLVAQSSGVGSTAASSEPEGPIPLLSPASGEVSLPPFEGASPGLVGTETPVAAAQPGAVVRAGEQASVAMSELPARGGRRSVLASTLAAGLGGLAAGLWWFAGRAREESEGAVGSFGSGSGESRPG